MVLLNLLLAVLLALLPTKLGGSPDGQGGDGDGGDGGDPPPTPPAAEGTGNSGTKTLTQAEVDALIRDRLARERAKYSNYDDLKKKAEAYDKLEESQKSDLDKANERAAKAEQAAQQALATANGRLIVAAITAAAAGKKVRPEAIEMLVHALKSNDQIKVEDSGEVSGIEKVLDDYLKGKDFLLAKEVPGKSGAEFNGRDTKGIDEQIAEAESKGDWRLSNRLKLQKARTQQS